MSVHPTYTYTCPCNSAKSHRLVFDGGQNGQFVVELCHECYSVEDKKFLISEERIDNNSTSKSNHKAKSKGGFS